jgi:hypothetical protein
MVSQQADLPSYCLGSIRFLFDQSRYLALFFRLECLLAWASAIAAPTSKAAISR